MHAHVLATTHAHADLQAFQAIPAVDALLVHWPAFPAQHDVDAQIAESRPRMCDLPDPKSQCRLIPSSALRIPTAMRELSQLNCSADTDSVAPANPLSQRTTARWLQSFF